MTRHSFKKRCNFILFFYLLQYPIKDTSPTTGAPITSTGSDPIVAHFVAHTDIVAEMAFDASGLLLMTADKRGHDFHVFRIQPHPCGSASAAVHHLYILHRGDTTAKVQDMVFSLDSRWAAISTARGTTHVFPVTPYGGPATYRTHGSPEVVNRLSRFHRSAGLSADGRSSSPVLHMENGVVNADPYHNPRLPPFPRPFVIMPMKQLRQPSQISATANSIAATATAATSSRQRVSSMCDDTGNVLRVRTIFARPRDWLLHPVNATREIPSLRNQRNAVDSLFIMASHGSMIQYDLEPRYLSSKQSLTRSTKDSFISFIYSSQASQRQSKTTIRQLNCTSRQKHNGICSAKTFRLKFSHHCRQTIGCSRVQSNRNRRTNQMHPTMKIVGYHRWK